VKSALIRNQLSFCRPNSFYRRKFR